MDQKEAPNGGPEWTLNGALRGVPAGGPKSLNAKSGKKGYSNPVLGARVSIYSIDLLRQEVVALPILGP